jgi:hypothetical protein
MFRVSPLKMNLDQRLVGYCREGKVECCKCGSKHIEDIEREVVLGKASRLYGSEGHGQVCEGCKNLL